MALISSHQYLVYGPTVTPRYLQGQVRTAQLSSSLAALLTVQGHLGLCSPWIIHPGTPPLSKIQLILQDYSPTFSCAFSQLTRPILSSNFLKLVYTHFLTSSVENYIYVLPFHVWRACLHHWTYLFFGGKEKGLLKTLWFVTFSSIDKSNMAKHKPLLNLGVVYWYSLYDSLNFSLRW